METNSTQPQRVTVKGKTIGTLTEKTFFKAVKGSRHKLRRPPGWSIDAEAFERDIRPKAHIFKIYDQETGLQYTTTVDAFNTLKTEINRGFGRQYMMPISYWSVKPIEKKEWILGG